MNDDPEIRTFIALELGSDVKRGLALLQESLKDRVHRARWTKPDGTHLTLKFLGEVRSSSVAAISTALDRVAAQFHPFELVLNGVGAFPRLSQPRVIWVGLKPNSELLHLQSAVEKAIAPLGFPTEKRDFHGHLTLARLEGDPWSEELRNYFIKLRSLSDEISFPVAEVALFRSDLQPGGAVYSYLHKSPLDTDKSA
ncbi:MAG: RNA 2',3'-cyclic phosphodiesterase [bacterium]|nr:RNA 2',3'-cyclic phosphodiesterase [bacterium]